MTSKRKNELRSKLKALVKPARLLKLERVPTTQTLPFTASRFGGAVAYGEAGDTWPTCANCGAPESFVCQIDLEKYAVDDPPPIKLLDVLGPNVDPVLMLGEGGPCRSSERAWRGHC